MDKSACDQMPKTAAFDLLRTVRHLITGNDATTGTFITKAQSLESARIWPHFQALVLFHPEVPESVMQVKSNQVRDRTFTLL
jgi:hypothetical protein